MVSSDERSNDFEKLIEHIGHARGLDLGAYKSTTLERRIQKRMRVLALESYGDYLEYLEIHQDEYKDLFDMVLINVTSFFRDKEAWQSIEKELLPKLIQSSTDGHLRVWVAGCASGQEAYSIAMLLAEQLGPTEFRDRV